MTQAPTRRVISFSPPDIGQTEIDEVVDTLKSGWITTGPKTKRFEHELAAYTNAAGVACLSSATAALECALRAWGIGPGDEVITSAYTYTASASPIVHVGATPVLVDVSKDAFEMDPAALAAAITPRTRAIIPVDLGGKLCDYETIFSIAEDQSKGWSPSSPMQEALGRIAVIADGAHALGSVQAGKTAGSIADMTTFSFHAVKNLTTAEGGALAWRAGLGIDDDALYRDLMLQSLHGQTKDALAKDKAGAWEYDIAYPGWKCNMTDIQAALGLAQLRRYPAIIDRRHEIIRTYEKGLGEIDLAIMEHDGDDFRSSGHLMIVRLKGKSSEFRNALISTMADHGVAANVHYKPLPLLSAYRNLGFRAESYQNAIAQFENEITLPLHTLLTDEDIAYVIETFTRCYRALEAKGI